MTDTPCTWRIRPATVDDVPAIVRVRAVAWADAYGHLVPTAHLAGMQADAVVQRWVGFVSTAAAADLVWVACRNDAVRGFGIGGAARGAADTGEVFALYVHPDAQGRGAGAALLERLEAALGQRWSAAALWVFEENAAARRFYARAGWIDEGVTGTTVVDDRALPKRRLRKHLV